VCTQGTSGYTGDRHTSMIKEIEAFRQDATSATWFWELFGRRVIGGFFCNQLAQLADVAEFILYVSASARHIFSW
jgi:hypothetical protein